jgi:transposase
MGQDETTYAPEFHRQVVELINAGRSPKKLARAFEPTAQSIRNWVAQPARNIGDGGAR